MALGSGLGSDLLHECLFWDPESRASRCLGLTFLMVGHRCAKAKSNYMNTYKASAWVTFANILLVKAVSFGKENRFHQSEIRSSRSENIWKNNPNYQNCSNNDSQLINMMLLNICCETVACNILCQTLYIDFSLKVWEWKTTTTETIINENCLYLFFLWETHSCYDTSFTGDSE